MRQKYQSGPTCLAALLLLENSKADRQNYDPQLHLLCPSLPGNSRFAEHNSFLLKETHSFSDHGVDALRGEMICPVSQNQFAVEDR